MLRQTYFIILFASLLYFAASDDDDLLTLNCYSCATWDGSTPQNCGNVTCTDQPDFSGEVPTAYVYCVKTELQYGQFDSITIKQASCQYAMGLDFDKFCLDLSSSPVPGVTVVSCEQCRTDFCNSY